MAARLAADGDDDEDSGPIASWDWRAVARSRRTWAVIAWFAVGRVLLEYGDEFGAHYLWFIGTMFYLMLANLGKREAGSLSAYPIFNEGFRALPGTMTGEHIDRQMRSSSAPAPAQQHTVQHTRRDGFADAGAGRRLGGGATGTAQEYDQMDDEEAMLQMQMAIAQSLAESKPAAAAALRRIGNNKKKKS
mmetsp:Transcript_8588/g.27373  ORF Transcript_8588/g.27373 Transcript_8588/m.27373 type:complete len:190 (-) Transcript_8588:113-682(-)